MYGLVDCNNFYVSCERAFRPELRERPVVVLSNNDGCIISRSAEAKALGLKMGAPYFKVLPELRAHQVGVFSSNYALYGDMSARVVHCLAQRVPALEVYSIDEVFVDLHGLSRWFGGVEKYTRDLRAAVLQHTHIPTCVGLAPTKTLAKLANRLAKKEPAAHGVVVLDTPARRQWALEATPVQDVWGIGRRQALKLHDAGVATAAHLAACPDGWVRQHLGGVVGLRLVRELRGQPCHRLHPSEDGTLARQSLAHTRSFGRPLSRQADVLGALSAFASRAAEKLRQQGSAAHVLTVFIGQNKYGTAPPPYTHTACLALPAATDDTTVLLGHVRAALPQLWQPGRAYVKAGVVLSGLEPAGRQQLGLFGGESAAPSAPRRELMQCLDALNQRFGKGAVVFGAAWAGGKRNGRPQPAPWAGRQAMRSPAYTTSWDELWEVKS